MCMKHGKDKKMRVKDENKQTNKNIHLRREGKKTRKSLVPKKANRFWSVSHF